MFELSEITDRTATAVEALEFGPPVAYVQNPLVYARAPHELYLQRYGQGCKQVVFVGMNPGPFGMAQTGVPFGEVAAVRDWLDLNAPVSMPTKVHPKRPIEGFACKRSEVSGQRLWGWARGRWQTPQAFFAVAFVHNYCPLLFTNAEGANLTPDKLNKRETAPLYAICDAYLRDVVRVLKPRAIVGVGAFAQQRALAALAGLDLQIGRIPHPSPASPLANRGWAQAVDASLSEQNIALD